MVQSLFRVFNFYLKSSIHVAIAVVSLALVSTTAVDRSVPNSLLIFIFSSTVFAYNFIKFFPLLKGWDWLLSSKMIVGVTLLSALGSVLLFFSLSSLSKIVVFIIGILVLLYVTPFVASKNGREIKGFKTLWVVLSWVLLTVGIPMLELKCYDLTVVLPLFCVQGIYVFVALLPFEIRDTNTDSPFLKTLPQRIGIKRVKNIGFFLLLLATILLGVVFDLPKAFNLSSVMVFVLLAVLVWKSTPKRSFYYTHFWVEALPLFWFVMIEILSNLHRIMTY